MGLLIFGAPLEPLGHSMAESSWQEALALSQTSAPPPSPPYAPGLACLSDSPVAEAYFRQKSQQSPSNMKPEGLCQTCWGWEWRGLFKSNRDLDLGPPGTHLKDDWSGGLGRALSIPVSSLSLSRRPSSLCSSSSWSVMATPFCRSFWACTA